MHKESILIVDDDRTTASVMQLHLNNYGYHVAGIASSAKEAIKIAIDTEPDLVLMDINMPAKNCIEATKEIRKFNTTIPIIALTAVEIEEIRHKIYLAGMDDIILKPYDISKFIETITKNITLNKQENKSHLKVI